MCLLRIFTRVRYHRHAVVVSWIVMRFVLHEVYRFNEIGIMFSSWLLKVDHAVMWISWPYWLSPFFNCNLFELSCGYSGWICSTLVVTIFCANFVYREKICGCLRESRTSPVWTLIKELMCSIK